MKPFRHALEAKSLSVVTALLRAIPRSPSLSIGESLGWLVYKLNIRTEVTRDNLRHAFPDLDEKGIERITKRCYRHFGTLLAEFARLPVLTSESLDHLVDVEGWDVLDQVVAGGKGGIVVSGHIGNWELMGAAAAVKGYPVAYVVTTQRNKQVELMMDRMRESTGVQIIKRRDAIKGVLKALKENTLIAILSDQDTHEAGVFVEYFGRLASTPKGAAMFSHRTGAPIIFAESYRQGKGPLKVVNKLLDLSNLPADADAAIEEITRRFTKHLEEAVRRHPEQWFWMHRRWKTSPPS
ncbi:lysophospholipid acyltransferase family protein [bacterium]|nr:lysophospholipid acyltransferase family protein [bacterium]